ncbi:unnamed protein product [marine sediment metagenome]|uniref:Uncharacterized protein n=1 Tax=marine sediment metagenome TaxID=412755 RepID=X1J332_9ZZZZ
MKLDKAIEILTQLPYQGEGCLDGATVAALKLGTEAMKRVQKYRPLYARRYPHLLPGETEF